MSIKTETLANPLFENVTVTRVVMLAFAYFITGCLGLELSIIGSNITLIWLPTGISVAVLFRWGLRYWLGVWLGAIAVNLVIGSTVWVAFSVSIGNTLGPVLAVVFLQRWHFNAAITSWRDMPVFIVSSTLGMMVSATFGVLTLAVGSLLPWSGAGMAWLAWWFGDVVGVIVGGMPLITFDRGEFDRLLGRKLRSEFVVSAVIVGCLGLVWMIIPARSLGYVFLIPLLGLVLVGIALRLGAWPAAIFALVLSACAAWTIAIGQGPFLDQNQHLAIVKLWAYMTTLSLLNLLVSTLVAERKQVEQSLQKESEKNLALLRNASDGIYILDSEGNAIEISESFCAMLGYRHHEMIGMNVTQWVIKFDTAEYFQVVRQQSINATRTQFETCHRCKDGTIIDVEVSVCQLELDGKPVFFNASRDITERKQIERVLRESEFLWKFAVEGSGDGVWDRNLLTNEMNYSKRWKEMLGYAENDILPTRQEWFDSIHPDDQLHVKTAMQDYLNGESKSYFCEYRLFCRDNSYKWILARGMVVSFGEEGTPLRMIGTHTDISALKNIQETLQEKEQMLSHSQRIAKVGSWSLDLATGCLSWSDEMYRIFGVTPEIFEHTLEATSALILPEDLDLRKSWFNDSLKGEDMRELVFRIKLPDGTIRFICSTCELQYDALSKPLRLVGSSQDISERKYQEQQDKEHLNQLAHVTRLGLMGEMASGIAHEVNQPLTAIATYTQASLNLMKSESPDLGKLAEIVYKTQQQALRAGQIIRRMREFVKANTRQVSAIDLNELIQDAVSLCLPELKLRNIALTLELQSPLPLINVDRIQIEQVIINLIRNSADAFDSCLENQQKAISIHSLLTLNEAIEVRVKDNGSGIPEDQQQKILMPFYTTKEEGMGMGLSISRSIIEAHDGKLHFNSQAGKGTTFYFTLPIK